MSAVSFWAAGTLYAPGAVVKPNAQPAPVAAAITNPGFESGDVDWTKGTGWAIVSGGSVFQGTWSAKFDGTGPADLTSDDAAAVQPGQSITCSCAVDQGVASAGNAGARVALVWYDSGMVVVSVSEGTLIDSGSSGSFKTSTVTAVAPVGAAFVAPRAIAFGNGSDDVWVDSFTWNHAVPPAGAGLIFRAVQAAAATSGATEPIWPTTAGLTVVDGGVTWEAMDGTVVVWEAHPILESGATEPTWGLLPDAIVADGTIRWRAYPRVITDANCPHTKVVVIAEGHVFAVDDDIVRFSAVMAPRDWTTESDAGFLNTGLASIASNIATGLALYRKNLTVWTESGFQLYQMDADPELMVGLDGLEGIGTIYPKALVPIADDLFFLNSMGIRTVNTAIAKQNMTTNDVGAPIDELVRPAVEVADANGFEPFAAHYPGLGQLIVVVPTTTGNNRFAMRYTGAGVTLATMYESATGVFADSAFVGDRPNAFCDKMDFSPDGEWLAIPDTTNVNVLNWSAASGYYLAAAIAAAGANVVTWSPDGRHLAVGFNNSGGGGPLLRVYRFDGVSSFVQVFEVTTTGYAQDIAYSTSGNELVIANTGGAEGLYAFARAGDTYTAADFPDGGGDPGDDNLACVFAGNLLLVTTQATPTTRIYRLALGTYTYVDAIADANAYGPVVKRGGRVLLIGEDVYTRDVDDNGLPVDAFSVTGAITGMADVLRNGRFWGDGRALVYDADDNVHVLVPVGDDYIVDTSVTTLPPMPWEPMAVYPAAESVPNACEVFVGTRNGRNQLSWSTYTFPFVIEAGTFQLLGGALYFRHGDTINKFVPGRMNDQLSVGGTSVEFGGRVRWNYLDCGPAGLTKHLTEFDFIGDGQPSFSVGYDERFPDRMSTAYEVDPDTMPGGKIPYEVVAPAMSFCVDFAPGVSWSLKSVILTVYPLGNGP